MNLLPEEIAQLQCIADHVSALAGFSLVLLDQEGSSLTIPSETPACCFDESQNGWLCHLCEERGKAGCGASGQSEKWLCPQGLYTWAAPLFINPDRNPQPDFFLIMGRLETWPGQNRAHEVLMIFQAVLRLSRLIRADSGCFGSQRETAVQEKVERPPQFKLSKRQAEILPYLAEGCRNGEIAKSLGIQSQTVKNHVTNLLKKLDLKNRTELAVYLLRLKEREEE